jgi:hypothetical protein
MSGKLLDHNDVPAGIKHVADEGSAHVVGGERGDLRPVRETPHVPRPMG